MPRNRRLSLKIPKIAREEHEPPGIVPDRVKNLINHLGEEKNGDIKLSKYQLKQLAKARKSRQQN